jgi:dTDP-4-amino-4,6-dideoxygalactose transaminase
LPVARMLAQQVLCLPIYPELPLDQVDRVVDFLT